MVTVLTIFAVFAVDIFRTLANIRVILEIFLAYSSVLTFVVIEAHQLCK